MKRSSENAGHTDEGRVEWANANFLQLAYSMSQLQARGEHVVGAVRLMSDGRQQAEQGLALAAEVVDIQDGAQKVVSAVGQFANQLSN